jgi:hypothetical protein
VLAGTLASVMVPPLKVPAGMMLGWGLPGAATVQLISENGIVSPAALLRFAGDVTRSVALAGPLLLLLRR